MAAAQAGADARDRTVGPDRWPSGRRVYCIRTDGGCTASSTPEGEGLDPAQEGPGAGWSTAKTTCAATATPDSSARRPARAPRRRQRAARAAHQPVGGHNARPTPREAHHRMPGGFKDDIGRASRGREAVGRRSPGRHRRTVHARIVPPTLPAVTAKPQQGRQVAQGGLAGATTGGDRPRPEQPHELPIAGVAPTLGGKSCCVRHQSQPVAPAQDASAATLLVEGTAPQNGFSELCDCTVSWARTSQCVVFTGDAQRSGFQRGLTSGAKLVARHGIRKRKGAVLVLAVTRAVVAAVMTTS